MEIEAIKKIDRFAGVRRALETHRLPLSTFQKEVPVLLQEHAQMEINEDMYLAAIADLCAEIQRLTAGLRALGKMYGLPYHALPGDVPPAKYIEKLLAEAPQQIITVEA